MQTHLTDATIPFYIHHTNTHNMGNISKSCKNLCGFDQAEGQFTAANEPLLGETFTGPLPSVVSK